MHFVDEIQLVCPLPVSRRVKEGFLKHTTVSDTCSSCMGLAELRKDNSFSPRGTALEEGCPVLSRKTLSDPAFLDLQEHSTRSLCPTSRCIWATFWGKGTSHLERQE